MLKRVGFQMQYDGKSEDWDDIPVSDALALCDWGELAHAVKAVRGGSAPLTLQTLTAAIVRVFLWEDGD